MWFQVRATSYHLIYSKLTWKSTPKWTWMCWREWCSPDAIRNSTLTHKSKETLAWLQKECYDFVLFSHCPPPLPTWTRWTTLFSLTSRTSPTWSPTTPKPAWSPPSAEYTPSSRRRLWKEHDPSSGSVSTRWLSRRLHWIDVSSTYIIKLPEWIF